MNLNTLKAKFRTRQGGKLELRAIERRYSGQFEVSDISDGYRLLASGRLVWHDAGHPERSFPATCTIIIPHRRLLAGGSSHWLFEDLCKKQCSVAPAWQDVADTIAVCAFGDRNWSGRQYGVIPGHLAYDGECEVTLRVNIQQLEAVCFYTRDNVGKFAKDHNYNVFEHRNGVNLVMIPVKDVLQMMST